jgi:putative transposase
MKRTEVEKVLATMSVVRQCGLLELSRSTFYYQPLGEDAHNLALMRRIDEQFTKRPFYGVARMTASLRIMGYGVNPKRVRRLMRVMGLEAIYPKPRLSVHGPDHKVYPYLLKGVTVDRPEQAWATDITYVRLTHGFVYLMAILDWYSRHVVSWELFTTLDTGFCLEALRKALRISKPEIFNTDQGPQFTSVDFTDLLENAGIKVSIDERGRVYDNIFVERLWRSASTRRFIFTTARRSRRRGHIFPAISSFTTTRDRMRRWVTGHRTKSILERGQRWRRLRRPWFDMDGFEIVAPEASGEAVFSGFTLKWLSVDKFIRCRDLTPALA